MLTSYCLSSPIKPADDNKYTPVDPEIFVTKWLAPQSYTPRCFIVPGSDSEFITERIYDFIDEENERCLDALSSSRDDGLALHRAESISCSQESTEDRSPSHGKRLREESDTESTHHGSPTKKSRLETRADADVIHLPYEEYTGVSGAILRRGSLDDEDLARLRARWIREDNIDQCRRERLDYPFNLQPREPASDGSRRVRNRGALRRMKFDKENPRKRFLDATERLKAYQSRLSGDPVISVPADGTETGGDGSDVEVEGPKICSWNEFFAEESCRKAANTARKDFIRPMGITKSNPKASPTKRSILRKHLDQQERSLLQEYDSNHPRAQDDDDDWENRALSIRRYRTRHATLRAKHRFAAKSETSGRLLHHTPKTATTIGPPMSSAKSPECQSSVSICPIGPEGDKLLRNEDSLESTDSTSEADCRIKRSKGGQTIMPGNSESNLSHFTISLEDI